MNQGQPVANAKVHIVCNVVIQKDNTYLLVQEKTPEIYGLWNLPGGRVDVGETLEQAAIREASEETGFEVELIKQVMVSHQVVEMPVYHVFTCKVKGGKLHVQESEILDARWFSVEQVRSMRSELRNPEYTIAAIEASLAS